jgi:hypothetical protein
MMTTSRKNAELIRQMMAAGNPAPAGSLRGSWRDSQGEATYQRIVAQPQPQPHSQRAVRFPRQWLPRPLVGIGAATALAVIGAVALSTVAGRAGPGVIATPTNLDYHLTGVEQPLTATHLPPARPVLLRLARAAARQPSLGQPPGSDIGYVLTREWNMTVAVAGGTSSAALTPQLDQTWTSPDGSFRQVERNGQPQLIGAGSQLTNRAVAAAPTLRVFSDRTATQFGPVVQRLPTSPAALRAALVHAAPANTFTHVPVPWYLFQTIAGIGHEVLSSQLTAAMWRVLAAEAQVRYLSTTVDRAGRPGEAVAVDVGGLGNERLVLIISPSTGRLLGEEDIFMTNPGKLTIRKFPAVIGYVVYLREGWTVSMRTPAP